MRAEWLSFFLALLGRVSPCIPSPRANRTESWSCSLSCAPSVSTLDPYRVKEVVRVKRRVGASVKTLAVARQWSEWRERVGGVRVVRLEAGCGRNSNRLATLEDGSRACVRYGVDQDQVLGETLCFHLAMLLGIPNVPPLALTKPDPSSQQWSAVRDSIEALRWSPDAIVSLTQWVPNATRVSIPAQLRKHMGAGVRPVSHVPWTSENMTSGDLSELMQWTDLILFDYLTANFDRVANHLFNLQWDRRAMDRATNNLLRTTEGHLVFIDNEAGLVHGYRVLDRWEHFHKALLNSTCVFRGLTVQRLMELKRSRSAAQCLRQVYRAREPLAQELGFLSEAQLVTLQNRVDMLCGHVQQCSTGT
ncbi:four-jointed box protein 1 [Salminus brasiliensis]|uniref:four-jointed box protein 1 n=1 Tax=Salminus brasiliensis TaxID=930266 RepID=UPI003B82C74A